MDHGQNNQQIKRLPVSQSPEQESCGEYLGVPTAQKTSKIITLNKISPTQSKGLFWNYQDLSFKEDSWRDIQPSPSQKVPKPSYQVCFWEALMTVALLIMALWMQGLPTKQLPQTIDNNTLPFFEMIKPEIKFSPVSRS